ETLHSLIELGWGRDDPSFRQVFTTRFMPDAGLDAIHAFNDMMPLTASGQMAARIHEANVSIDVRSEAARVKCPTLVLHARGDLSIPFEEGRLIASLIPGARFVSLESRNHLMPESDPAWRDFLAALNDFYPSAGAATHERAFAGLTARESEVLELIAQGLDNAQIAARLDLSEKTVRNNITHIFDKIQVENRSQAIVRAREAGLGAKPSK
ncbi:MAG TPA: LuxR C-terminal-related transcriptional regulator, partial [Burkholderiales bacterium]|nr:LuxR C-terminal-related transcriptional regulator [Burkholderiales bacterium]